MNHDNVRGAVCVANSQVCRGGALPPRGALYPETQWQYGQYLVFG